MWNHLFGRFRVAVTDVYDALFAYRMPWCLLLTFCLVNIHGQYRKQIHKPRGAVLEWKSIRRMRARISKAKWVRDRQRKGNWRKTLGCELRGKVVNMHDSSQWFKAEKVLEWIKVLLLEKSHLYLWLSSLCVRWKIQFCAKVQWKEKLLSSFFVEEKKTFPALVDVGSFKFSRSLFNGVLGNSFHTRKLFASQNKYWLGLLLTAKHYSNTEKLGERRKRMNRKRLAVNRVLSQL